MDSVPFWLTVWGLCVVAILLWWHGRSRWLDGYTAAVDDLAPLLQAAMASHEHLAADEMLTQCSWCKRIKAGTEDWAQLEQPRLVHVVTHGACPDCAKVRTMALQERLRHG